MKLITWVFRSDYKTSGLPSIFFFLVNEGRDIRHMILRCIMNIRKQKFDNNDLKGEIHNGLKR